MAIGSGALRSAFIETSQSAPIALAPIAAAHHAIPAPASDRARERGTRSYADRMRTTLEGAASPKSSPLGFHHLERRAEGVEQTHQISDFVSITARPRSHFGPEA
jgi:hypothetical protein